MSPQAAQAALHKEEIEEFQYLKKNLIQVFFQKYTTAVQSSQKENPTKAP